MKNKPTDSAAVNKLMKAIFISFGFFFVLIVGVTIFLLNALDSKQPVASETQEITSPTETPVSTPTPIPAKRIQKTATLNFKNVSFTLSGFVTPEQTSNLIWQNAIETSDARDFDSLLDQADFDKLYYLTKTDSYYENLPGGYNTWSLVSESFLSSRIGSSTNNDRTTTCTKGLDKVENIYLTTLECRAITNEDNTILDDVYSKTCFYEYEDGKYLMFATPLKPISSDIDNCAILEEYGISEITLIN